MTPFELAPPARAVIGDRARCSDLLRGQAPTTQMGGKPSKRLRIHCDWKVDPILLTRLLLVKECLLRPEVRTGDVCG